MTAAGSGRLSIILTELENERNDLNLELTRANNLLSTTTTRDTTAKLKKCVSFYSTSINSINTTINSLQLLFNSHSFHSIQLDNLTTSTSTRPPFPPPIDTYSLSLIPSTSALHSTKYSQAQLLTKTIKKLDDSNSTALDEWHEKRSKSFRVASVVLWDSGKNEDGTGTGAGERRCHTRIRSARVVDKVEEDADDEQEQEQEPQQSTHDQPQPQPLISLKVQLSSPPPPSSQRHIQKPPPLPLSPSNGRPSQSKKPSSQSHSQAKKLSQKLSKLRDPFHIPSSDDDIDWIFQVPEPPLPLPLPRLESDGNIVIPESDFEQSSNLILVDEEQPLEEDDEDEVIFKKLFPSTSTNNKKRKRKQLHVIESDSSSSSLINQQPRPPPTKIALATSSSPPVKSHYRPPLPPTNKKGKTKELSIESSVEVVRVRKKLLRRGEILGKGKGKETEREEGDLESEEDSDDVPLLKPKPKSKSTSKSKSKPSKRKPPPSPRTLKTLLDLRAIHSSGGSQSSSSESFDSENSDDRNFVAGGGDTSGLEDEDSRMMRFRAESLMTQVPGGGNGVFKTTLVRHGGFKFREPGGRRAGWSPATPGEGRDDDLWSYDSFCVEDEEEVSVGSDDDEDL